MQSDLQQNLAQNLANVLQPIHQARGLPNECYTSEDYYKIEMERIFHHGWFAIGFTSDVKKKGDVYPVNVAGHSFLITRNGKNELRVFHNVCRHRGHILVQKPANMPLIRCPYHSWCYNHDGALKKAPHVGGVGHDSHPDFKPENAGLLPVRYAEWLGVVFVNPSGKAQEFSDYIASPKQMWQEYTDVPLFANDDSRFGFDLACNWKFAIENYCESYHLPWVHPDLNSYSKLEDHYNIEGDGCSGQGTIVYQPTLDESGRRLTELTHLSDKWSTGGEYLSVYPNLLSGVHKDHIVLVIVMPNGAGRSTERGMLFYFDEEAVGDKFQILRRRMNENWYQVFKEDVTVVEGMQLGRGTAYDGGTFSPAMDGPNHCFHQWVANKIQQGKIQNGASA
ncbi:MAG: aromatic ring-hydroxylating dioxygenase subunit alpha [Alphaproteobacteria bacterium]|nr:aromatic ring-hydroxylating dioxygenase subunit alpha [Alphaproteobacteria bacterium]